MLQIMAIETTHYDAVWTLVARLNPLPYHHIGYWGVTPSEIGESVQSMFDTSIAFLGAHENDQLVGTLAVTADVELGRAWLYGPVIEHPTWQELADRLYAYARTTMPSELREHEIFCDLANRQCCDFAARHSFGIYGDWHILNFERHQITALPPPAVPEAMPEHYAEVHQLHDHLFPTAHLRGKQMIDGLSTHAKLFVVVEEGAVLGYSYSYVDPVTGEAMIDFVGVHEAVQGRGIGQRLLVQALHWLFSWPTVEQVSLSVKTDNIGALRLYERAGFIHERTMRAFRKTISSDLVA